MSEEREAYVLGAAAVLPGEVSFVLSGKPVPKARPRVVNGRVYTLARTRQYEVDIGWAARTAYPDVPMTCGVSLAVDIFEGPCRPQHRGDLDNYVKAVSDALNGIIWADDVQVEHIHAHVFRDCAQPRTAVRVWPC